MKTRAEFPRAVRRVDGVWVPMPDGCRLAARIWVPTDAEEDPVPAILEAIPYRLNDGTVVRDELRFPYLAGHGYACVRLDLRGSGESDGVLYDEYLLQEQEDVIEAIAWIAAQPWCSGAVGMIGISWGGFLGLQVAARRPPALKAIITLCSTDDRYADDVHYKGGCVLALDMLHWASCMLMWNARPPDPAIVGGRWRDMWLERMEQSPPFVEAWLSHQRRDVYWRQGSVCEDYSSIECAVYAVGGWSDGYTNAVLRLLFGLPGPRKGLIGPWAHTFPELGVPGPAIGFLQEALRWWDRWLKGIDTGIMGEPMLRAWMQDSVEPLTTYLERPGRWVAEAEWPSPRTAARGWALNPPCNLEEVPGPEQRLEILGLQATGLDAGAWCAEGSPTDWPPDQRAEDGASLSFDSEPLAEPLEILGFPELTLTLSSDCPLALLAVRLCDVAPAGASLAVTRGLLNLTHRESHEEPSPLEPGRRYVVAVHLDAIAHRFPAGHRLRVAVSPTYWPWAWPSPETVALSVFTGGESRLVLPVRPPRAEDAALEPFEEPEGSAPLAVEVPRAGVTDRVVRRDFASGRAELVFRWDSGGSLCLPNGLETEDDNVATYTIVEGDPLSAQVRVEFTSALGRGDWHTRVETTSTMSAESHVFHVTNALEAYEGDTRVFTKTWTFSVPRDGV